MCTMSHFCPQCLPPCERRAGGLLRDAEGTPAGNYISTQQLIISFFFFIRCFDNVFRDIFVSFSLLYALFPPLFSRSLSLYKDGGDWEGVVQRRETFRLYQSSILFIFLFFFFEYGILFNAYRFPSMHDHIKPCSVSFRYSLYL